MRYLNMRNIIMTLRPISQPLFRRTYFANWC